MTTSKKEKRAIEFFHRNYEKLRTIVKNQEFNDIFLVAMGVKPGAILKRSFNKPQHLVMQDFILSIESLCEKLSLTCKKQKSLKQRHYKIKIWIMSTTYYKKHSKKLTELFKNKLSIDEKQKIEGKLLGIPNCCIKAYGKKGKQKRQTGEKLPFIRYQVCHTCKNTKKISEKSKQTLEKTKEYNPFWDI